MPAKVWKLWHWQVWCRWQCWSREFNMNGKPYTSLTPLASALDGHAAGKKRNFSGSVGEWSEIGPQLIVRCEGWRLAWNFRSPSATSASHEESRFAQDTVDDLRRKIAERVGFASEAISLHLDGRPLLPTEATRVATELGASVGGVSSSVMGAIAIGGVSSSIMDAIKIGGVSS